MSQNFSLFLFEVCALFFTSELLSFRGEKKEKKGLFDFNQSESESDNSALSLF